MKDLAQLQACAFGLAGWIIGASSACIGWSPEAAPRVDLLWPSPAPPFLRNVANIPKSQSHPSPCLLNIIFDRLYQGLGDAAIFSFSLVALLD